MIHALNGALTSELRRPAEMSAPGSSPVKMK